MKNILLVICGVEKFRVSTRLTRSKKLFYISFTDKFSLITLLSASSSGALSSDNQFI